MVGLWSGTGRNNAWWVCSQGPEGTMTGVCGQGPGPEGTIIIIIDNFCIALFSGVHKLIALYNILQYFLSQT